MRRPSKNSSHRLSGDSQKLVNAAQGLMQSSSRLEERVWERNLDALLRKLLKTGHQETVDAALDHLFKSDLSAYETLMEAAEAGSESCHIEHDDGHYDALLIAAPILAWTRFSIASGTIPTDVQTALSAHLHAHLLSSNARLAMAPTLFAIDQLPHSHAETLAMTQRMAQAALKDTPLRPLTNPPETAPFLADTRYVLAVVVVRAGEPLFLWQETANPADRERAASHWRAQAMPNIMRLLPGCNVELLLPEAYHIACREADKFIRPASIRAAVHYLTNTLATDPQELRAIIGSFSEEPVSGRIDEYRISFTLRHSPEVIYGVVWPLYGQEDEDEADRATIAEALSSVEDALSDQPRTPSEEILALLRESGIVHIKRHSERFPLEFCDDCGSPLYPDPDADLVHAEMPEDVPSGTGHFH
ncbi:DUF2863 family protein [Noviherbaspirillum cavernae]|uniref:DUF2863 family protein n=1 Tax=Noviherbaspirillum cavernae TaxID=2320862 RepID=A0A418X049_9BURK|nr:DUF2863 family protein [Noviherbaspirillum cavernae]RJG05860.1 DUF2863 family protein [Noviherbaspirillum cavernae]